MVRAGGGIYHVDSVDSGEGRDWPGGKREATRACSGAAVHRHSLCRLNAIIDYLKNKKKHIILAFGRFVMYYRMDLWIGVGGVRIGGWEMRI